MLENSRAPNSRVFIGVLSKFPKLKTPIFRIAGQPFIRWIRVIRSLSNLCLNCNHCISIISRIFWTPANKERKTTLLWTVCLQACKLKSPDISSYSYGKNNSSFAELNESSDASEGKDCSESWKYSSEVSQSTVGILSQICKETPRRWASDVTSY